MPLRDLPTYTQRDWLIWMSSWTRDGKQEIVSWVNPHHEARVLRARREASNE